MICNLGWKDIEFNVMNSQPKCHLQSSVPSWRLIGQIFAVWGPGPVWIEVPTLSLFDFCGGSLMWSLASWLPIKGGCWMILIYFNWFRLFGFFWMFVDFGCFDVPIWHIRCSNRYVNQDGPLRHGIHGSWKWCSELRPLWTLEVQTCET